MTYGTKEDAEEYWRQHELYVGQITPEQQEGLNQLAAVVAMELLDGRDKDLTYDDLQT